jgi:N-acetylglucosamine kinase-like BadF-type ATPase
MAHRRLQWLIGVDGGGTKTLGILADRAGNERARHTAGPSNPNSVGIDAASRALEEVIEGCRTAAHCGTDELAQVVLGLAGAGSAENREALRARLSARFGPSLRLHIETDARIALEGALSGRPGIVIIAGTGSIVAARDLSGGVFTAGGWGRALGDEGSGFFIGTEAAKAFAMHMDGMLAPSGLPRAIRERFGWDSRETLIRALYREKAEPAALAPVVLELAGAGDGLCEQILRRAARALAAQARALLGHLTLEQVPVATCGGLIDHPSSYRAILVLELGLCDPRFAPVMPEHPAAEGALMMALAIAGGEA